MIEDLAIPAAIILATVIATEVAAAWIHRHVMHGWGWGWHRSHHEARKGYFERNDLYSLPFAALSTALCVLGSLFFMPLLWVGVGLSVYGLLYYLVHDGLVHQRWPFRYVPRSGYLRRLYQAHRLHHAVNTKEGAVSFGFLFARPVAEIRRELQRSD
ncbi:MAG: sterol desaturase family protein [Pseudomonadota bacterium]